MPKVSPNQKLVIIHRAICDKEHIYAPFNRKAMELAMKKMNGRNASGFLVWCYLSLNADGFELALSNKDALVRAGIKKDSYDSGVSLLIENGYLVQKEGNTYDFYQFPNGVEPPEDEEEKKG